MKMVYWTLDKVETLILWGIVSFIAALLGEYVTSATFWCSFITLWILSSTVYIHRATAKIDINDRAVLVTGCDSGFGQQLALYLDQLGFTVFAGCLFANNSGDGAQNLRSQGSRRMHVIQMDVTSQEQILIAKEDIIKLLPRKGLWGIVNNAGWSNFGELEWVPLEDYVKITDINVIAVIRVCKAFLPLIRKSKGRIINMASGFSRMSLPMRSSYVLTKYAVQGLSDSLRYEMRSWGVNVSIIEPGNYIAGTNIFTHEKIEQQKERLWETMSEDVRNEYGEAHFQARVDQMKGYAGTGMRDLTPVIMAYTEALTQQYPQVRYQPMNLYFKMRNFVAKFLPEFVYESLYISIFRRKN